MTAWITVIGIGEDGISGLSSKHRQKVLEADFVVAAQRHVDELRKDKEFTGEVKPWPSPFSDVVTMIDSWEGHQVVALATGDPLWYGAASTLVRHFDSEQMEVHPAPSGFQLAAARMGWPMQAVDCLTMHGRPVDTILPYLAPRARLLVLAQDRHSTKELSKYMAEFGYGKAVVTALGHIGGEGETRQQGTAKDWTRRKPNSMEDPPDFHVIAIECPPEGGLFLPRVPGLPDIFYKSDGNLTKSETRAVTLARLGPRPGGLLWDLGCGSGSVGIEWMRAARGAMAIGVDNREDRLIMAEGNAQLFGVPQWEGRLGTLPEAVADLPDPDAAFIGGGLSTELAEAVLERLPQGGRLVVNAVTLESEELLLGLMKDYGGDLTRLSVSRIEDVGEMHGWRPLMTVTQWSYAKLGKYWSKHTNKPGPKHKPKARTKSKQNSGQGKT